MNAKPLGDNRWELSSGQILARVHGSSQCSGQFCTIHNPSLHHMSGWEQAWHGECMVRVCPHDIVHADPDSSKVGCVFDCDGCCTPPTNDDILDALEEIKRDLR